MVPANRTPLYRSIGAALVLLAAGFGLSGCASYSAAPVVPPQGWIYTNVSSPMTTDFNQTPVGPSLKMASASKTKYFYVPFTYGILSFGWDDAEIRQIALDAGITDIAYVEHSRMMILGIYGEFGVHVYGN